MIDKFKNWLEGLMEPPRLGDVSRRGDLIGGGLDGCTGDGPNNLPMGVRGMCQKPTSAFQTYSLPKGQKKQKKQKR